MKKADRLISKSCLDEINCAVKAANKPLIRKKYLEVRKWYQFQKEKLLEVKYNKKVPRFPKHRVKKEILEENND